MHPTCMTPTEFSSQSQRSITIESTKKESRNSYPGQFTV